MVLTITAMAPLMKGVLAAPPRERHVSITQIAVPANVLANLARRGANKTQLMRTIKIFTPAGERSSAGLFFKSQQKRHVVECKELQKRRRFT